MNTNLLLRVRICLVCLALPAFPQQSGSRHITLDVVVTGKDGKPVPGLTEADFTLLDNKKPQKLELFQPVEGTSAGPGSTVSVETILLIDRVNTTFQVANDERTRLLKYLRTEGKLPQPTSLVFFTDSGTKIQSASRDGNVLADALDHSDNAIPVNRRGQGILGYAQEAQMSLSTLNSIATLEAKKPGRKVLIWLSAGWPAISGPQHVASPEDHKRWFDTIVETSSALLKAHITLYTVDPIGMEDASQFKAGQYDPYMKPVTTVSKAEADNLALAVLVNHTGGRTLNASNDVATQIADCIGDQSAYYIMSFAAPPAGGPNEYHAIEFKIEKPGLKARTLTGYYAQP
jgi:VWFA-related protein